MKELISPNHINVIRDILDDKFYADHFIIYDLLDSEDVWNRLSKMTEKQYRYFHLLLNNKRWFDIKNLLDSFLKHK